MTEFYYGLALGGFSYVIVIAIVNHFQRRRIKRARAALQAEWREYRLQNWK